MNALGIRPRTSLRPFIEHIVDGVSIACTLPMAQYLLNQPIHESAWLAGLIGVLVFYVVGDLCGMYRSFSTRNIQNELTTVAVAWGLSLVGLVVIGFATRLTDSFPRSSVVAWFFLGGLHVATGRAVLRVIYERMATHGIGVRKCAVVGMNPLGLQIADNARNHPECGMAVVGFFDDREESRRSNSGPNMPPFIGDSQKLIELALEGKIDTVLIALPMKAEGRIRGILERLSDTSASVYLVPDFFVFELLHSQWTQIGGLPAVSIFDTPIYGVDGWTKRIVDMLLASIALVLFCPIMLICAMAVKLSSPGPIFFLQKRFGLDGREFKVWKFRSMTVCENGADVKQATRNDPRVTKIGAILRKTSLDELPQLFNVIGGSMSLVGPRPLASAHNQQFRRLIPGFMLRHKVKPGITGLAQVSGSRGETDTPEKMQLRIALDHRYIREWSLWLDLKILLRTIAVVMRQENAY